MSEITDSYAAETQTNELSFKPGLGDRGLEEMFGHCMPRLFQVADYILRNHHDSEDALQDGLLSAIRHFDQFRGNSQFSTWLFSIIRNAALANLRKQRNHPMVSMAPQPYEEGGEGSIPETPAGPSSDPERTYAQVELSCLIAHTLESLPANYRAIIRLCDLEGFTGREAAHRLGLSVSALKAQHHRARKAIRVSMGARVARKRT